MSAIEYSVVPGQKTAAQLTHQEVHNLSWEIQSPILNHCCGLYAAGSLTWEQAMQTAAVELAKALELQQAEIVRLRSLLPVVYP